MSPSARFRSWMTGPLPALDILPGYGSQESGVRSQNGAGIRVQHAADFFQNGRQAGGLAIAKILGENQVVAAFFDGAFSHIYEAGLVWFPATSESLSDVRRDRDCRPAKLLR